MHNQIYNITRIEYGGRYEEKIEKLYNLKKQSHRIIEYSSDCDSLLDSLLDFAQSEHLIVTFEYDDDDSVYGFIREHNIDDESVTIDSYDLYAKPCGVSVIDLSYVYSIYVDTDFEQSLRLLIGAEDS